MSHQIIISSTADIRTWIVNTNPGGALTAPDLTHELTEAIQNAADRPAWGEDWREWLEERAHLLVRELCEAAS